METKYYYVSFVWADLCNNFEHTIIDIHPIDWMIREDSKKLTIINWIEISKEQFDKWKH